MGKGREGKGFTPCVAVLWGPDRAWGQPHQATLGLKTQGLVLRNVEICKCLTFLGKKKKNTQPNQKNPKHRLLVSNKQPPDLLLQRRALRPFSSLIKLNRLSLSQGMMCRASVGEFGPSPIQKPPGEAEGACGSLLNPATAADMETSKISVGVIQMWLPFSTPGLLFFSDSHLSSGEKSH